MTSGGQLIRMPVKGISVIGRNTQGVRLIKLDAGERLIGVEAVTAENGDDVDDAEALPSGSDTPPPDQPSAG